MQDHTEFTLPTSGCPSSGLPRPLTPNAFTRSFLHALDGDDDPPTAAEAAAEGPWTVVRLAAGGCSVDAPTTAGTPDVWAVVRHGEDPAGSERPIATASHPAVARLVVTAVPLAARSGTYRLGPTATASGFPLLVGPFTAGHLATYDDKLLATLNLLDALLRSPRALADLLEAAGGTALRCVGTELRRRHP